MNAWRLGGGGEGAAGEPGDTHGSSTLGWCFAWLLACAWQRRAPCRMRQSTKELCTLCLLEKRAPHAPPPPTRRALSNLMGRHSPAAAEFRSAPRPPPGRRCSWPGGPEPVPPIVGCCEGREGVRTHCAGGRPPERGDGEGGAAGAAHLGTLSSSSGRRSDMAPACCRASMFCVRPIGGDGSGTRHSRQVHVWRPAIQLVPASATGRPANHSGPGQALNARALRCNHPAAPLRPAARPCVPRRGTCPPSPAGSWPSPPRP